MRTDADQCPAVVQHDAVALQAVPARPHNFGHALIERVRKANVRDGTALEECKWPDTLGPIDHLVRDDEVAGLDLLLQTADGREGDDGAHADGSQGGDVRTGGDLMGRDLVVQAVAAEEGHGELLAVVRTLVVEDGDG